MGKQGVLIEKQVPQLLSLHPSLDLWWQREKHDRGKTKFGFKKKKKTSSAGGGRKNTIHFRHAAESMAGGGEGWGESTAAHQPVSLHSPDSIVSAADTHQLRRAGDRWKHAATRSQEKNT